MIQQELAVEKRIVLDSPHFTRVLSVRQPLSLRDLDRAQDITPAISRTSPSRASTTWATCCTRSSTSSSWRSTSPAYNYIIHTAPFDHERAAALSLAHRGHSAVDEGRGLRVGLGVLHQPGSPRERCGVLAGSAGRRIWTEGEPARSSSCTGASFVALTKSGRVPVPLYPRSA